MTTAIRDIDYDEGFQRTVELIGRRWSGAVLRALLHDELRFNALTARGQWLGPVFAAVDQWVRDVAAVGLEAAS